MTSDAQMTAPHDKLFRVEDIISARAAGVKFGIDMVLEALRPRPYCPPAKWGPSRAAKAWPKPIPATAPYLEKFQ